jgi:hypothetical protein
MKYISRKALPCLWLLGAAGLMYIYFLPYYPIGSTIDDAGYLLAARSLTQGQYVNLAFPTHPPLNIPMPGYPLFLAPFVLTMHSLWVLPKLVSILVSLLGSLAFWYFLKDQLNPPLRLLLVAMYAFHPAAHDYVRTPLLAAVSGYFFLAAPPLFTIVFPGRTLAWRGLGMGRPAAAARHRSLSSRRLAALE